MTDAARGAAAPTQDSLERLAAGLLMVGFPADSIPDETKELAEAGVRNFILFARNVGEAEQIKRLTGEIRALAGDDALIAIDHEGGRVNRLRHAATQWPSPMAWSATGNLDLARDASRAAAQELSALGINLNFAPVADILVNHRNPVMGNRCFSDDPRTAAAYVAAFVEGHHDASIGATAKHFPGHGGTEIDSHIDLPSIDYDPEYLRANDLIPFAAAVEAGVDCVMISHIWYSEFDQEETPATVSRAIARFAREELGYEGAIITDCMEMGAIQTRMSTREAIPRAILAGCDLAIVSHRPDQQREAVEALAEAVRNGVLSADRLVEANRRLDALRGRLCHASDPWPDDGERLAREIARQAITLLRDENRYLPLSAPAESRLGVVTFSGWAASQAEERAGSTAPLVESARRHHPEVVDVEATKGAGVEAALEALRGTDTVLVGTTFATGRPFQTQLVKALLEAGKRVIVVALRDPFDFLAFPQAPCFLATYDDTTISTDAALAVIFGKEKPRGHLPVILPGLYPRGHGLTDFSSSA